MKTIKAISINALIKEVYKKEGWVYDGVENRYRRVMAEYGIAVDVENNRYVATKGNK